MDSTASPADSSSEPLTRTPLDLLTACVVTGKDDTKSLAAYLGLSPLTIDSSFKRIHERLGTNTRWQAIHFALRHGWVEMPEKQPTVE